MQVGVYPSVTLKWGVDTEDNGNVPKSPLMGWRAWINVCTVRSINWILVELYFHRNSPSCLWPPFQMENIWFPNVTICFWAIDGFYNKMDRNLKLDFSPCIIDDMAESLLSKSKKTGLETMVPCEKLSQDEDHYKNHESHHAGHFTWSAGFQNKTKLKKKKKKIS